MSRQRPLIPNLIPNLQVGQSLESIQHRVAQLVKRCGRELTHFKE